MSDILWRGMTRAELDTAYDNRGAVKNSAAKLAEWTERSARLRAAHPALLDLPYGPRPRNRIDVFRAGARGAPLVVFFHGGYWQRNAKELFACVAEGALARGFDVALPGYTLAPDATMSEIVAEVRAAIAWLRTQGPQHGVGEGRLVVSGWSAGGHLTAMAMAMSEVDAGLAISGIYDLEPCRLSNLNDALRLSAEEAAAMSPIRHLPHRAGPLVIAYGAAELPELQRQSRDYGAALREAGLAAELTPLAGHDHFSILEELASPAGQLTDAVARLASR
ncbi:MAG TPA: alpha/beta hydrolase [Stellaceae bacterium]|nr:alpha/beta hydrolase [Stellaceae bacterium]